MFSPEAAPPLNHLARLSGDRVSHLLDFARASTRDEDIPALCKAENVGVLLSVNFRDFGAKKLLYETLMDQGIHIGVLRPGKGRKLYPESQVSLIAQHLRYMHRTFSDVPPNAQRMLVRLTESGAVARSLDELIDEIENPKRSLP